MSLTELLLEQRLDSAMKEKRARYAEFTKERANWSSANRRFEVALSKGLHLHWLSKSRDELENAVASLFDDLHYEAVEVGGSGNAGIDLILKKENRTTIVQCKAWSGQCGPAVIREAFGAMHAMQADDAIVVCPRGFTQAATEFAKDKPIRLLSVDELSMATYAFEQYLPHWLSNPLDVDKLRREMKKRYPRTS